MPMAPMTSTFSSGWLPGCGLICPRCFHPSAAATCATASAVTSQNCSPGLSALDVRAASHRSVTNAARPTRSTTGSVSASPRQLKPSLTVSSVARERPMCKLRRLYVDNSGVPSNRFVDLCTDATDLTGEPCDTIVWLRNGAGKTTMLSLLLALVLPHRRDFLASRTTRRTLEDLVGEGKDRLKRYWWCLRPDDGIDGATFDSLPTTTRTTGAVDLDRFAAHI